MQAEELTLHPPSTYSAAVIAFETDRILARGYCLDDAEQALAIYGDAEVMRFLPGAPVAVDVASQRTALQQIITKYADKPPGFGGWAIVDKATNRVIGTALFKPATTSDGATTGDAEIGWHLARSVWGNGYATEMGRLLIAHGHITMGIDRLIALVDADNTRSLAVVNRLGMQNRGITTRYYEGDPLLLFESRHR